MKSDKVVVCIMDPHIEWEEYLILSKKEVIDILNERLKNDPEFIAFMDAVEGEHRMNEREGGNQFTVDRKTGHIVFRLASELVQEFPYESEMMEEYVRKEYKIYRELV